MQEKFKVESVKLNGFRLAILALCSWFLVSIQAQDLLPYPLDTVNGEEVYRYEVEKSIGLYRIGVNFNVPQNEIVRLNPQLRERGLHYGETLLLPTGRPVIIETKAKVIETVVTETKVVEPVAEPVVEPVAEPVAEVVPEVPDSVIDTVVVPQRRVIELALMLPFESQQTKRSTNAERMMEFYQGALLALQDLQNDSTLFRLRVYDTERSERRVNALCDSTDLDSVQGILGLVYPIQIERMSAWCNQHHVPLLLPFSDDIDLAAHPYILQFNSTDTQEADSLCAWMKSRLDSIHCVAIEVRDADLATSIRTLRRTMRAHDIPYTGLALRDLMNDSAAYALDSLRENVIILHSDRYQHVRIMLPQIAKLQQAGFRVRIVSQYSWQKENIVLPQVYTSVFTRTEDREVYDAIWANTYVTQHVSENPRYDLLGYDLMRALVGKLRGEQETNGLQSAIRWTQINNGGYQNACVQVITY